MSQEYIWLVDSWGGEGLNVYRYNLVARKPQSVVVIYAGREKRIQLATSHTKVCFSQEEAKDHARRILDLRISQAKEKIERLIKHRESPIKVTDDSLTHGERLMAAGVDPNKPLILQ
jgi:hypothetical protein